MIDMQYGLAAWNLNILEHSSYYNVGDPKQLNPSGT